MRADEIEGPLNDTNVKRAHDLQEKLARRLLREDLDALTENPNFLRWFAKYMVPAVTQDFPVNNGSLLAQFMGRRQLILDQVKEMDEASPGFLPRVFSARQQFESQLEAEALKAFEDKEQDNG